MKIHYMLEVKFSQSKSGGYEIFHLSADTTIKLTKVILAKRIEREYQPFNPDELRVIEYWIKHETLPFPSDEQAQYIIEETLREAEWQNRKQNTESQGDSK
jgi:hypothetical protein